MADNGNNMMDEGVQETEQVANAAKSTYNLGKNIHNGIKKANDHFKGNGNNSGSGPNQPGKGPNQPQNNANGNKNGNGGNNSGNKNGGSGSKPEGGGKGSPGGQGGTPPAPNGTENAAVNSAASSSAAGSGAAGSGAVAGGGAASGGAVAGGAASGPPGWVAAAVMLAASQIRKAVKDPSSAVKFIIPILIPVCGFIVIFWILSKILNPYSSTNTVDGDNIEALQVDVGKDENFLNEYNISPEEMTDEIAIKYKFDHQYDKMAKIIADAVAAGYEASKAQYPIGKQNAKNSIDANHDAESEVYLYDGTYYGNVKYLNTKNTTAVGEDEKELEGNAWDDADYLTDNSRNGAFESGTAYIIAAYSVSKGNTSPVAQGDDYTYYDSLKKLMNQTDAKLGYFKYSGSTISTELTQKVKVNKVEKVIKYEKKTDHSRSGYCSLCTASKNYDEANQNNSNAKGTFIDGYTYACDCPYNSYPLYESMQCRDCGHEYSSGTYCPNCWSDNTERMGTECQYCGDTLLPRRYYSYYKCPAGHIFGSSLTGYKANTPGASSTYYTYSSEYFVYEVVEVLEDEEFTYTSYKYTGNIAPFSYQDLLERMFLDDNPFYEDVQGTMYAGTFGGNAATITAGTEIVLPEGLGSKFSYMAWQLINAAGTDQLKLKEQTGMPFDSEGFGKINGRYVIACTTTYGRVGDYIDFYQSDGTVLKCIIGDIKNQADAGCNQWGHQNGDVVVEFIVDRTSWYHVKDNVGTPSNHPELGGKTITKAVNGGSYFTNPDFVQSLNGNEPGETPTSTQSSDLQLKVANLAVMSLQRNMSTEPPTAGYCAAWVSGIYAAAGLGYPGGNAIDYWTKWKDSGSSDPTKIPVGAAVVGSGSSNPSGGMLYGHVGIYVGDTDGDGEGEVVDNIGGVNISSLSHWISWQTTPTYPSYGGCYGPGFIGWVWPNGNVLGEGYDYTGVDPSTLVYNQGNAGALSRAQRLANIMASSYYQWGVYYEYECDHPKSIETKCPECDADMKVKTKGILWWKTELPCFEYVKAEEPDKKTVFKLSTSGDIIKEQDPYSVSEKIDWYVNNLLNTIDAAAKYESGFAGNASTFIGVGGGNLSIVQFALSKVGTGGQESWAYFGGWEDQWCSMFVSFCAASCGFEDLVIKTAGCDEGMNWFKSKGLWQNGQSDYEPKPGDFIYFSWDRDPNDAQHVGIVEKVENGQVYTIEGNCGGTSFRDSTVKASSKGARTYPLKDTRILGYGTPEYPSASNLIGGNTAEQIYNYLIAQGLTDAGAAGLMGNLQAESALRSDNMENSYEGRYNDASYTQAVDSGAYSRAQFKDDAIGYGLAQWTYKTRKAALYDYAQQSNVSISDLGMQLEFLMTELSSGEFAHILGVLRTSNDLRACTKIVLYDFENPRSPNLEARLSLARPYYRGT